jgi:L-xylulokinase
MLLGLDIGVSVVKASLFSEDGTSCVASLPHPVQSSRPDWMEKDAEVLWQACCTVIRDALAKLDSPQVDALGHLRVWEWLRAPRFGWSGFAAYHLLE